MRVNLSPMASACVNNIGVSTAASSYGWLGPRLSFTRENDSDKLSDVQSPVESPESPSDLAEFEFRLDDYPAAAMLPADKLFSGGKLVPLHLSALKPSLVDDNDDGVASPEKSALAMKSRRRSDASFSVNDPYLFSPKAPRCSSRWRELLGLKKLYNTSALNSKIGESQKPTTTSLTSSSSSSSSKSLKNFLHRSTKSYSDSSSSSLILPLLSSKDSSSSDSFESLSLSSSRLSLSSSSSSGLDHDDLPRHSLDFADKPPAIALRRNPNRPANPRPQAERAGRSPVRRRAAAAAAAASRGVSVDSPRMNSSGKIVFQSLERSSSSPSSFCNGGPRYKHHRGMERSYSGGVRVVTPVLNVPVCSLRVGFGQLFSPPQKRSEPTHTHRSTNKSNTLRTT